jgi:hypothetical protein
MSLIPMSPILILRSVALGMSLWGSLLLTQSQASKVIGLPEPPKVLKVSLPSNPQRQQYQTQGVIFETPLGFSPLKPLGGETTGVIFPAAAAQTRHVSIRLLEINPSDLGISALGPRELAEYVRFNILGITTTPRFHQTRQFMGQAVTGDVLMQPQNSGMSYLELYLVPMTLDRQLAIAFEADTELPVGLLEQTITTVSASLREDPAVNKKKKRRPSSSSLN